MKAKNRYNSYKNNYQINKRKQTLINLKFRI